MADHPLTPTEIDLGRRLLEDIIKVKIKKYKVTLYGVLMMKFRYNNLDFLDSRLIDKDLNFMLLHGINNTSGLDRLESAYDLITQIYDKLFIKLSTPEKCDTFVNPRDLYDGGFIDPTE